MNGPSVETSNDGVSVANLRGNSVTPKRKSDYTQNQAVQFDQVVLFQWLSRIANECSSLEQLLKGGSEVVCCQSECLGLWVTQLEDDKSFSQIYSILNEPGAVEWETFQVLGRKMIKLAAGSSQIQCSKIAGNPAHQLIIVPVIEGRHIETVIAGCFHRVEESPAHNEWLMGIFAQSVSNWLAQKKLNKAEIRSRSLNDVVALTSELDRAENLNSAALILVNQLKKLTQSHQVSFAACNNKKLPRLMAISDLESVDHSLESTRSTTQACGKSMQLKQIIVYPDRRQEANIADTLPLEQYCKSNGFDACISLPVIGDDDHVIGAILLAVAPKQATEDGFTNYLTQLAQMVSGHLAVVLKANQSLASHVTEIGRKHFQGRLGKIALACAAVLFAVMLIPWPYRIGCECEIQPVLRRFIAAPHDGVLEKNLVENGDVIEKGQIVANLDGRQLRIEMAGLEAELKGTSKKRSAAMASGQIAEAQISLSEMKNLQAQIQLVRDKLQNLEIRSPIDGIVVAGDLEKVEGAPVEMGQTLFEIGPLDHMLAEIAIPEQEIPYVKPGMKIRIKLNAYPFKTWLGTVSKIHAKSEIKDTESVFVAEVELENSDFNLKPGMKGYAKVQSTSWPIGWNLFHHPFEKLRYWTIW